MKPVLFERQAFEDLKHWSATDRKILNKIIDLLSDIQKHPFDGLGKPEPLKHQLKGFWSRRITDEHRLVYCIMNEKIIVASCRYHYS
jgi:toxin YoeB